MRVKLDEGRHGRYLGKRGSTLEHHTYSAEDKKEIKQHTQNVLRTKGRKLETSLARVSKESVDLIEQEP